MKSFIQFIKEVTELVENRLEYLKKTHKTIDTSHDEATSGFLKMKPTYNAAEHVIDHIATHADPSPKKEHTQWMVGQYKKKNMRLEDSPRYHEALTNFSKFKGKLAPEHRDLNKHGNISSVEDATAPHVAAHATAQEFSHPDAEKIHDANGLKVWHLKTQAASEHTRSCFDNKWCTSKPGKDNYHDHYSKNGPLYMVHHPSGEKRQYHFESNQFMDHKDNPVHPDDEVKKTPELANVKPFKQHIAFNSQAEQNVRLHSHIDKVDDIRKVVQANEYKHYMTPEHISKLNGKIGPILNSYVQYPLKKEDEHYADKFVKQADENTVPEHKQAALHMLSKSIDLRYIRSAAKHPGLHLANLVDQAQHVQVEAAQHPDTAHLFADSSHENVRQIVAGHKHMANHMLNDPSSYVKQVAVEHANSDKVGHLVNHSHPNIRKAVALYHPIYHEQMKNDKSHEVRAAVADNPKMAHHFVYDENSYVRGNAARVSHDVAKQLINDQHDNVRYMIASKHKDLAHHFLNDPERYVREAAHETLGK